MSWMNGYVRTVVLLFWLHIPMNIQYEGDDAESCGSRIFLERMQEGDYI